ncbi:hypothetical protein IWZ00DRAFT_381383 [Phyllosticta capitalensis]
MVDSCRDTRSANDIPRRARERERERREGPEFRPACLLACLLARVLWLLSGMPFSQSSIIEFHVQVPSSPFHPSSLVLAIAIAILVLLPRTEPIDLPTTQANRGISLPYLYPTRDWTSFERQTTVHPVPTHPTAKRTHASKQAGGPIRG